MTDRLERQEVVKLLLVDDRNDDLEILRMTLDAPGHELVTARSGAEALRRVLAEDFACIVLDVLLPMMDGFEVATLIKSRDRSKHTPILFLTAAGADMRFIYRAYQVGAVDFMTKPIDPDVLRAKVAIFADLFRKDLRIKRQAEALREAIERQKEAELAALREGAEKRYRHLADAFPSIVWTARPDGGLDYANRRWHEYSGMPKDSSRGWGWLESVHPEDVGKVQTAWREAIAHQGELTAECRVRRSSGEYRWHICCATPELDGDGGLVGWVATMTDTEDLRQAISARDEFLAVASHELRTPLSTLALAVHGLRRAVEAANAAEQSPKLVSKVDMAERQVVRLDKLVSALLDVTRIVGRRVALEPVDCDLSHIARDVVERLREAAERVGSEIKLVTPGVAQGRWDPLRIDQVLTNLVSNAVRHGAGKPIELSIEMAADGVRMVVRDHGEGIPPEQLPSLFGRFQRGESSASQGGLGLGLFISRHIAQAHGGDIRVESSLGEGATFTVELPRQQPKEGGA